MASMNFKRVAVVATLATSIVLMSGAAFAAPATNGLTPDQVGETHQTVRNIEADAIRQIRPLPLCSPEIVKHPAGGPGGELVLPFDDGKRPLRQELEHEVLAEKVGADIR